MMAIFHPAAYQVETTKWLISQSGMLIAPMGSGKTVMAASAMQYLYKKGLIRSGLILAPFQVARMTWPAELRKWGHLDMPFTLLSGEDAATRTALLKAPFIIANYELIPWLAANDIQTRDCVIIDEVTKFKSHNSKRMRTFVYAMRTNAKRAWGMTASPVTEDDLHALWGQWNAIDGGQRLGNWTEFCDEYFTRNIYNHTIVPRKNAFREVTAALASGTKRIAEETVIYQRPELIPQVSWCQMPQDAQGIHDAMLRELVAHLEEHGTIPLASAGVAVQKCHQTVGGGIYTDPPCYADLHDEKLRLLEEVIAGHEKNTGILVAYWYQHELERIRTYFNGVVEAREHGAIDAWNEKRIRLMAIHPSSAGHGLNLQPGGNVVVFYCMPWSHGLTDQTIGRVWRQGQERACFVHFLAARDSIDEALMDGWRRKVSTEQAIKERFT